MARVMFSAGMFASRAARTADRRRALWSGSPPPVRAATVTSRISLVKSAPLLAPIASFLRLIFVHRLWPDILELPLLTAAQPSIQPQSEQSAQSFPGFRTQIDLCALCG